MGIKILTQNIAHEKPTEMPSTTKLSDLELKGEGAPYLDCLKDDLAVLRVELQEMKSEFNSKLNKMLLVLCPVETRSYQVLAADDKIPVWMPLPTARERFNNFVGRCAPMGDEPAELRSDGQPWLTAASTTRCKARRTNCILDD